jgi:hypothetical protein
LLVSLSIFKAHDSQVSSFDGVGEFLHIPFVGLELFDYQFFSFPLISILSSSSEILSSTCASLLEWLSIVFCISV